MSSILSLPCSVVRPDLAILAADFLRLFYEVELPQTQFHFQFPIGFFFFSYLY